GIRLDVRLPAAPIEVEADQRALSKIVVNLLSNALKFTGAGGSILLGMEPNSAGALEIAVVDTGAGIAPEAPPTLGRVYQQSGTSHQNAQGRGLGLYLVKSLAHLHGGSVRMESRQGRGTTIKVILP